MKSIGSTLAHAALTGALALAAIGSFAVPATAQAQPGSNPLLWCFVGPNDQPGNGPFGRCTSFYPSSSYRADFEVRNLPAGNYSYVWTNDLGMVLPCTTNRCYVTYQSGAGGGVIDTVSVTYTNLATGVATTLGRTVAIGGPI
ncbi:hypothetical protein [Lysobacter enzymogenes]|uniref:hypothetical protein n=1 Tax=Lysobacter enzymogenes TaxID=69 RepID=UPI0011174CD8|nr:hypothetical protein [Lysobacter enzymogenes]QQP99293.1 hypothetical protein JHW41_14280 [Lysobacter enzymogenes]UZW58739.1 hypothetical protein BV903_015620 [Lysobacter enzymogenes]